MVSLYVYLFMHVSDVHCFLTAIQHSQSTSTILVEMQSLARNITQFTRCLRPVEQLEAENGLEITVHALAHAAMVNLHNARNVAMGTTTGDLSAINSSLMHATEILKLLEKVANADDNDEESSPGDPILSVRELLPGGQRVLTNCRW